MTIYSSIVPSEMTEEELHLLCDRIIVVRDLGLDHTTIKLSNGYYYEVSVDRLPDYVNELIVNK